MIRLTHRDRESLHACWRVTTSNTGLLTSLLATMAIPGSPIRPALVRSWSVIVSRWLRH